MGDMAMTIEELRNAAAAINDAADWLSRQFRGEPADGEPTPAKEPELKLEDDPRCIGGYVPQRSYG